MIYKKYIFALIMGLCGLCMLLFVIYNRANFLQPLTESIHGYVTHLVTCCPVRAVLFFSLIFIVMVVCAVPLIMPLTFMSGMFFGFWMGGLLSLACMTIGGLISFLVIKTWFVPLFSMRYQEAIAHVRMIIVQKGLLVGLLFLHFVTVVPYVVINTFAALFDVSLPLFIVTTVCGSTPIIFLYAFLGSKATTLYHGNSYFFVFIVLVGGLLLCLPLILMSYKKRSI